MKEIVVIGAGAIGLATAWRLAGRGDRVRVFERGEPGEESSGVAAGMLALGAEADPHSLALAPFRRHCAALYPEFAREVERDSGLDVGFERRGTLAVGFSAYDLERLRERERDARAQGLAVRTLDGEEARALEPALSPRIAAALRFPDDHAIDPRRLSRALLAAALGRGVQMWDHCPVHRIVVRDSAVTAVEHARGRTECSHAVLAAGAWSGQIEGLPEALRAPVRPVRGQILRLRPAAGGLEDRRSGDGGSTTPVRGGASPLLTHVVRGPEAYLVPRADGDLLLGATSEEKGYAKQVTVEGVLGLLRAAYEMVPGVADFAVAEALSGLRPASRDGLPLLGPCAVRGLLYATGHYRSGILLVPGTAEAIAAWIEDREPAPEARGFGIERAVESGAGAHAAAEALRW